MRNDYPNKQNGKYILVFGDSNCEMFSLLTIPNLILNAFHGATMKGLAKPDNDKRKKIINIIARYSKKNQIQSIIFCFGTVDVQFGYYYTKLMNKPYDPEEIILNYIKFIKSIVNTTKYKVGVMLAYPSAISDKNMFYQLNYYNILDDFYKLPRNKTPKKEHIKKRLALAAKDHNNLKILEEYFKLENRIIRITKFNNVLKNEIHKNRLYCLDIIKHMLFRNGHVKPQFIPVNPIEVHFNWEQQLPYLVNEARILGITDKFINMENILAIRKAYNNKQRAKFTQKKSSQIIKSIFGISGTLKKITTTHHPSQYRSH